MTPTCLQQRRCRPSMGGWREDRLATPQEQRQPRLPRVWRGWMVAVSLTEGEEGLGGGVKNAMGALGGRHLETLGECCCVCSVART